MTFLRVGIDPKDKGRRSGHWMAYWKTPQGNFIHAQLPLSDQEPKEDAEAYAQEHPPTWNHG
jgi:hypothetical protein